MFTTAKPYRFHVELTDKCNAACPMCPRIEPLNFAKTNYDKVQKIELSLDDFEEHFTADFCTMVAEVEMGGGLGDPLAASQCLEICEALTDKGVSVVISTNASLRNRDWWRRLGEALRRTPSRVDFHIDGLKESNPLYRINTNFDKIKENAETYLATGAAGEWHYILFKHNEDDVAEARALSQAMGFAKFVLIDTIRFGSNPNFKYQMPSGEYRWLEPPSRSSKDFGATFGAATAPSAATGPAVNGIRCKSEAQNRAYINTEGYVSACCWVAGSDVELNTLALGGLDKEDFNIRNRPLAEILEDEPFVSLYRQEWLAGSNPTCQRKCGAMKRNTVWRSNHAAGLRSQS